MWCLSSMLRKAKSSTVRLRWPSNRGPSTGHTWDCNVSSCCSNTNTYTILYNQIPPTLFYPPYSTHPILPTLFYPPYSTHPILPYPPYSTHPILPTLFYPPYSTHPILPTLFYLSYPNFEQPIQLHLQQFVHSLYRRAKMVGMV